MAMLEGGCSCGAVRFAMKREPIFTNCCHCLDCQRQTGSGFVINAIIETSELEVSGETQAVRMPTDSGRPHDIYRCPKCEVALWSEYGGRGYVRFVRVGALDEPGAIKPDAHVFTRSKQPWVGLGDIPAFEVFYDMKTQWPAESLARRESASKSA